MTIPNHDRHVSRRSWVILGLLLCACTAPPPVQLPLIPGAHPPVRIGKVTREMILLDGGVCDARDLCFDKKSQRDFDCNVEFYCVPTNVDP